MLTVSLTLALKIVFVLFGCLVWNFIKFSDEKDKYDDRDEAFPYSKYLGKNWDNLVKSLMLALVFLILGKEVLHFIVPLDGQITWSDSYYVGSGLVAEVIMQKLKAWKEKNKN